MLSNDHHALLAVRVSSWHTSLTHIRSNQLFIEGVCVRVVNVVVDTGLVVEAGWLPELLHVVARVVEVKSKLREVTDEEESQEVSLKTSIEALEVRAELLIAFIAKNLYIRVKR